MAEVFHRGEPSERDPPRLDWLPGSNRIRGGNDGPESRFDRHRERRADAGRRSPCASAPLELTYADLDERSARLAALLREKGLQQGDRVGVMLPNVLEFPIAYYGVLRAGGVVVPMNVLLKRREIAFYLEDSGAKLLLAWHGFGEEAREGAADAGAELIEVEPEAFAELLGRPRAGRRGRRRPTKRTPR